MSDGPASSSERGARGAARLGWICIGLILWLVHFQLPQPAAPPELDPSWQQALNVALARGIHFGSELVFTFGPLGGPAHGRYEPELFWAQLWLYHVLFMGLVAARWVLALKRWSSALDVATFVLVLCSLGVGMDAYFLSLLLAMAAAHLGEDPPPRRLLALDVALMAALGYVKFTYMVLAAGLVLLVAIHAHRRGWRAVLLVLGAYGLACAVVWLALGQRLLDLALFVWRSAQLASGYSESQAFDGPAGDLARGLWVVAVLAAAAVSFAWLHRRRPVTLLLALALAGAAFVAFRASYTFHVGRAMTFFGFASLAAAALVPRTGLAAPQRAGLALARAILVTVAVWGFSEGFSYPFVASALGPAADNAELSARFLLDVRRHEALLAERSQRTREQYALPRTRAIVGSSPIDLIGSSQGWIFLNDLNWKPRPVFQSYAATNAALIALNGAFFESDEAPEFVLLEAGSWTDRIGFIDDNAALWALLARYTPVVQEHGLVLFRRLPERAAEPRPSFARVAEIEGVPLEPLRLDSIEGRLLRVRFDVRYSLLGRLRRFFLRAPITLTEITCNDQIPRRRRIVPGMSSPGIIVRPGLEFPEDWVDAYTLGAPKTLDAFVLGSPNGWDRYFEPTYRVIVERCDELLPVPDEGRLLDLVYGFFPTPPVQARTPSTPRYLYHEGRDMALVGPDARLVFALEAGTRRVTGAFGLLDGSESGDGVDFTLALVQSGEPAQPLLQVTLDRDHAQMRRFPFELELDAQPGDHLVLATLNPPGRNPGWDLAYVEGIEIR